MTGDRADLKPWPVGSKRPFPSLQAGTKYQPLLAPADLYGRSQRAVPLTSPNAGWWVLSGTENQKPTRLPGMGSLAGASAQRMPTDMCSATARASLRPSSCPESFLVSRASQLSSPEYVCRQVSQTGASCQPGPGPTPHGLGREGHGNSCLISQSDRIRS